MTTIIINRAVLLRALFTSEVGETETEPPETMDEFILKYEVTLRLRILWNKDPSLLDDMRSADAGVDACLECWEGGGTIEAGHVRLWP